MVLKSKQSLFIIYFNGKQDEIIRDAFVDDCIVEIDFCKSRKLQNFAKINLIVDGKLWCTFDKIKYIRYNDAFSGSKVLFNYDEPLFYDEGGLA